MPKSFEEKVNYTIIRVLIVIATVALLGWLAWAVTDELNSRQTMTHQCIEQDTGYAYTCQGAG